MTGIEPLAIVALAGVAAVAGFIDAIAGGGGLLTLPALLLAGLPPHLALGTNKGQSVWGSGTALARFARSGMLDRRRALWGGVPGLGGAALGVLLVTRVPPRLLTPVVMALLLGVAVLLVFRRPGATHAPRQRPAWVAAAVGSAIAAYDGFFGPGTGTFLIMAFVWLWGDRLDIASANAKAVNFASNLASVAAFGAAGLIAWSVALPMALGQIAGGWAGAHVTIARGQGVVRGLVIAVSLALVVRLGYQFFAP